MNGRGDKKAERFNRRTRRDLYIGQPQESVSKFGGLYGTRMMAVLFNQMVAVAVLVESNQDFLP